MRKIFLCATALLFAAPTVQAQWLTITSAELPPYDVPAQLIRDHLTGPGVEILDVQFDGVPGAVGYFTNGDSSLGLHRGLLLTTGRASSLDMRVGAEEQGNDFASTDNSFDLSDPLLAALATDALYDLTRYRITFRASGDSIRFRYVFASEEYPEYSCSSFNDAFGFFLEGPGYPTPVNIARVSSTNFPVAINNVHPAYSIGCPAKNGQFYHNNNQSAQQPTYDGLLDVFVADAAVRPCGIYTMTLALADGDGRAGNSRYAALFAQSSDGRNADQLGQRPARPAIAGVRRKRSVGMVTKGNYGDHLVPANFRMGIGLLFDTSGRQRREADMGKIAGQKQEFLVGGISLKYLDNCHMQCVVH